MNIEKIKDRFHQHVKLLQDQITEAIKQEDPEITLKEDIWQRKDFNGEDGGGGITRAFEGKIIENAGVNTSLIYGDVSPQFSSKLGGNTNSVWAAGISLIIHPFNPKVPTTHANFRMIQQGEKIWFGGGADLTPFYPYEEDFKFFHQTWKDACSPYKNYNLFKKQCDQYFMNTHRNNEMRGIGGIFFDHYNSGDLEKDYSLVSDLSNHFIKSYFPLVQNRKNEAWTKEDEEFQLHRRGRYVEFNLLHDRGTKFGLETNGRTDSILISLPARCKFSYQYQAPKGSVHEKMAKYYQPYDWFKDLD